MYRCPITCSLQHLLKPLSTGLLLTGLDPCVLDLVQGVALSRLLGYQQATGHWRIWGRIWDPLAPVDIVIGDKKEGKG